MSKGTNQKRSEFASKYEAEQLRRQVVVSGRIKSMNESIFYNVDELHAAIANNRKISFEYLQWTLEKKLELKWKERYVVSPWALNWVGDIFPDISGFSPRNIKYMRKFAETYEDYEFVQRVVAQIPWRKHE